MNDRRTRVGIQCPKCGNVASRIIDSRPSKLLRVQSVRRRRHCTACDERFTTYELPRDLIENAAPDSAKTAKDTLVKVAP